MKHVELDVSIPEDAAARFAELSGDWNPLHTDAAYAATTAYAKPILHGAYAAMLVSRIAGMYLPGQSCLLHNLQLRFAAPIFPPAKIKVRAELVHESVHGGEVDITISDSQSGNLHTSGSFRFGLHDTVEFSKKQSSDSVGDPPSNDTCIIVTGASSGLGNALASRLGTAVVKVSRAHFDAAATERGRLAIEQIIGNRKVSAVVHCGWPPPDNQRLVANADIEAAIATYITSPLSQVIGLARILVENGISGAPLLLIGSTAAKPGRHGFRSPLYSLGKSMLPSLASILAVELAVTQHRCIAVNFDTLDGGSSAQLSRVAKAANSDRSPWGDLQTLEEGASQIEWILSNPSRFLSGASITLSGGALP